MIVLAAVLGPPIALVSVVGVGLGIALRELWALRRAGPPVLPQLVVAVVGLLGLLYLGSLGDRGAAHPTATGYRVWLVLAVSATWAADVGAYAVGSIWGRRKILPRISPGKTWEGTFGGFGATAVAVLGIAALFGLGRPEAAVAAVTIGPVAFAGDLLESWLKRRAGVKDSGTLFPGHGGMLDRIDSLVAVAILVSVLTLAAGLG
ncbi:MAG TPA: phosphatidate cytidylyltransferase [Candidatus Saccharimonadales bacterium]|nr:phosphatidate cytidylyltransferase [Candidatus Saccharimonadales bacterium]